MTAADVLEILDRLDRVDVQWWVHGGWGIDALLGTETRPHDDLDLAVARADIDRLEAGLSDFERLPERDEWPASFVLVDARGRHIDIPPIRLDEYGNGWQERRSGEEVLWSRADLTGRGRIKGHEVRCTSPEFEARSRLYDGHDDIDRRDLEMLCERFGLERPSGPWPGKSILSVSARGPTLVSEDNRKPYALQKCPLRARSSTALCRIPPAKRRAFASAFRTGLVA